MNAEDLYRIGVLFRELGWPIEKRDSSYHFLGVFERFCRMWDRLTKKEQELIYTLTKSYLWVTPSPEGLLLAAWEKMSANLPPGITRVVVLPLPSRPKVGSPARTCRPKSTDYVHYLLQGLQGWLQRCIAPRAVHICSSCDYIENHNSKDSAIVFVDDFVGTGRSAIGAIRRFVEGCPEAEFGCIIVLAAVCQAAAVQKIKQGLRCRVYAGEVRGRGIRENGEILERSQAIETMRALSKRIGFVKNLLMGYGRTEALVTLTKTPNNTFPVYWTTKKVAGVVWDAPFPRGE